jgi:hypothetical protein
MNIQNRVIDYIPVIKQTSELFWFGYELFFSMLIDDDLMKKIVAE